jgi:hypothetical protein
MNPFFESALILIAVLPTSKDLEIARVLGWYRIPARMAPKIVDVDYIGFYQTGEFPDGHRSMIEYYAEVSGHELTTRAELIRNEPLHPRAAEEYFKIQISDLQRLNKPILAERWKRITFFYTLGGLMNSARSISDLIVRSDDREILWKSLRERSLKNYSNGNSDLKKQELDPKMLLIIEQIIALNNALEINGELD